MASIILQSAGMRRGKVKQETTYLRQFPGKRRFEKVSADDWAEPLPHRDIGGYGHILRLEADVRVWGHEGQLLSARKWPSRSYIRNFARILRNIFGQNVQLVDRTGASQSVVLNNAATGAPGVGLIPEIDPNTTGNLSSTGNPELSGVGMAIGDGVAAEVHTRNDLVNRVGGIYSARQNLVTSVLSAATTTLQVTSGVTNGQAASVNVTEIGMFLFALISTGQRSGVPFATLLAYDGIASTPVPAGGVIAPRYTMDFPM